MGKSDSEPEAKRAKMNSNGHSSSNSNSTSSTVTVSMSHVQLEDVLEQRVDVNINITGSSHCLQPQEIEVIPCQPQSQSQSESQVAEGSGSVGVVMLCGSTGAEVVSDRFSMADYVFSSDEDIDSVVNRFRDADVCEDEIDSPPPAPSDDDDDPGPQDQHNEVDSSPDDTLDNSKNLIDEDENNEAEGESQEEKPKPAPPRRKKRSGNWSEESVDFESDFSGESSDEFVISPFSASPELEVVDDLSESDDDRVYDVEFEVASVSEINDNPIEDANSSSDVDDDRMNMDVPKHLKEDVERDTDNFADGSDSGGGGGSSPTKKSSRIHSSDSELSDKDKWFCSQCNAKSLPHFRYCLRCFRIRRNWLPRRPKSRKSKRRKLQLLEENRKTRTPRRHTSSESDCDVVDGVEPKPSTSKEAVADLNRGFLHHNDDDERTSEVKCEEVNTTLDLLTPPSSNPGSEEGVAKPCSSTKEGGVSVTIETGEEETTEPLSPPSSLNSCPSSSQASSSVVMNVKSKNNNNNNAKFLESCKKSVLKDSPVIMENVVPGASTKMECSSSSLSNTANTTTTVNSVPMCTLCCVREKDAAFVHNKIAHHFCCFVCADKILKKNGKCPICRDRVFRVVKIISV